MPGIGTKRSGAAARSLNDVRLALTIAFLLIVHHLSFSLDGVVREFYSSYTRLPMADVLSQGLFVWTMGLIWVSYRRWHATTDREAEFAAILASMGPELVMVVDPSRNIIMCNETIAEVFGYSVGEVLNRKADVLYRHREGGGREMQEAIYQSLREVGFHRGEGEGRRKDGSVLHLEIITSNLKGRKGEVVLIQDISERKHHEQLLREAKERAEAAVCEREEALAELAESYARLQEVESHRDSLMQMIVHDMKSPLAAMDLQIQVLQSGHVPSTLADNYESLDALRSLSRRLDLMVMSLLDVSQLKEGVMPLHRERTALSDTIESAIQIVGNPKGNQRILVEGDVEIAPFEYDAELVQRILANLLVNAVKYDHQGTDLCVCVQARQNEVVVSVNDRGPGIPPPYRETIFEKFGRVTEEGYHRKGSSGLGLTFCRMALEAHGGRIGVDDREGGGSRFWFTLPLTVPSRPEPSEQRALARDHLSLNPNVAV